VEEGESVAQAVSLGARPHRRQRLDAGEAFVGPGDDFSRIGVFEWATGTVGYGCINPDAVEHDPMDALQMYFNASPLDYRTFEADARLSEQQETGILRVYPFRDTVALMNEWREVFEGVSQKSFT
jgi:hypothetical protein